MFKLPKEFFIDKAVADKNKGRGMDLTPFITEANSNAGGYFFFPRMGKKEGAYYMARASSIDGWHHVVVAVPSEGRPPTWEEMTYVKNYFWSADDVVFQFHTGNLYLSTKYQLHLWQPIDGKCRLPNFQDKLAPQPKWVQFKRFWVKLYKAVFKSRNPRNRGN